MKFAISVLGSGGPVTNPTRASSGVLVWIDGRARILIDAGGGVYERLGRARADLSALDLVLLTHTHIDHTGGLAPVVFDLYMRDRKRALSIVGPTGRDIHPGCIRFTDLLFGKTGAWSYLHTFKGFGIDARETNSSADDLLPRDVSLAGNSLDSAGVSIRSVGVSHGMMPSVAYRIAYAGLSVTVSGDVSLSSPALVELARDTDLLVHDMALPERDMPHGELHAKPSGVGKTARDANVRALLTTHFLPPIESERAQALEIIRSIYAGPVAAARDLTTYQIGGALAEIDGVAGS